MQRQLVIASAAVLLSVTGAAAQSSAKRASDPVNVSGCVLHEDGASSKDLVLAKPGGGAEYRLMGSLEPDLAPYIGQRVDIVGKLVGGDTARTAPVDPKDARLPVTPATTTRRDPQQPTGGVTDPKTGHGVPPGAPRAIKAKDAAKAPEMPRLQVVSVKMAGGACQ